MEPRDFDSFAEVIAGFAELKGKQLSAPAIELYWRAMQHWTIEEFRQAAQHLLRTCEFMPVPKDFEDLRRAGEPTGSEAWTAVLAYCAGKPGDPITDRMRRAADAVGGIKAIGMANVERDLPFVHKRFLDAYAEYVDVDEKRQPMLGPRNGKALPLSEITKQIGVEQSSNVIAKNAGNQSS